MMEGERQTLLPYEDRSSSSLAFSSESRLEHQLDPDAFVHKAAHWLRQHQIAQHRIHSIDAQPVTDTIRSIVQNFRPAPIPEDTTPPLCECGNACKLMYDIVDHDDGTRQEVRVWVCANYVCFFVQVIEADVIGDHELCGLAHAYNNVNWDLNGSLGKLYFDEVYAVDRFATLWGIFGMWGHVFSNNFFKRLTKLRDKKNEIIVYPESSQAMPVGSEYDGFISYRWKTGRASLHLTFCSVFAMPIVMVVALVVYPILAVIFYLVVQRKLPHEFAPFGTPVESLGEKQNYAMGYCWPGFECDWYWFQILGSLVIVGILMFGGQLFYAGRKWFLDRCSPRRNFFVVEKNEWGGFTNYLVVLLGICQSDPELTTVGILRLPLYLANSKVLYCFFDEQYLTRTWCMVELAFFASLRKDPKIEFISVPQHEAGTILMVMYLIFQMILGAIDYALSIRQDNATYPLSRNITANSLYIVSQGLLIYFGRIYFRSLDALVRVTRDFDVRNCQCSMEADQPMLLKSIDNFMGDEGVTDSGIERFNNLVKQNLRIHARFTGPRSILVVSYIPCFIIGAIIPGLQGTYTTWMSGLDLWMSGDSGPPLDNFPFKWFVFTGYVYLVANPVMVYIFFALLKLLWWIEKVCKLKNLLLIVPLYAAFLCFDVLMPVRLWLCDLAFGCVANVIIDWKYGFHTTPFQQWPQTLVYPKPAGLGVFSEALKDGHGYLVPEWGRVLVILWLVVSTVGTYWLFETVYLKRMRLKAWSKVRRRLPFGEKDLGHID